MELNSLAENYHFQDPTRLVDVYQWAPGIIQFTAFAPIVLKDICI